LRKRGLASTNTKSNQASGISRNFQGLSINDIRAGVLLSFCLPFSEKNSDGTVWIDVGADTSAEMMLPKLPPPPAPSPHSSLFHSRSSEIKMISFSWDEDEFDPFPESPQLDEKHQYALLVDLGLESADGKAKESSTTAESEKGKEEEDGSVGILKELDDGWWDERIVQFVALY